MSQTFTISIPAGPLLSNDQAQKVGPKIAVAHQGKFTGQWTTVVPNQQSVINVELPVQRQGAREFKTTLLAGPLFNNDEAQLLGPHIAASYGGEFTGQWNTIVDGQMSVIQVLFRY
jgi:hypothetical protein